MTDETFILESKLKRLKISYAKEKGRISIGKPQRNYLVIVGLIIVPLFAGFGIAIMVYFNESDLIARNLIKIIAGIIFLFGTAFFNFSRITRKKEANQSLKILENNTIKINTEFGISIFDAKNTNDFVFTVAEIDEETFEGNLYLVDKDAGTYQILGFDDENEKYVLNDLKWFSEFFLTYINPSSTEKILTVPIKPNQPNH